MGNGAGGVRGFIQREKGVCVESVDRVGAGNCGRIRCLVQELAPQLSPDMNNYY